jgi:hypothetical protein
MSIKIRRWLPVLIVVVLSAQGVLSSAAPAATWVNVTGNLANMASTCGNLEILSAVPNSDRIIAGIGLAGLWASDNSGAAWFQLGNGSGSDVITNRPFWIQYDPAHPQVFWESGNYNGGGVYQTTDDGSVLRQLGAISHIDFVSVDFTDPNRRTLLAGGHEQSKTVYKSLDGGQTWTNIGSTLPASTGFTGDPIVINSNTYVVNAGWGNGVYRTTNGGSSWQQVSPLWPGDAPLITANGTIYWSFNDGLLKSSDSGQTWTIVGSGLRGNRPIELFDGRLVSVGGSTLMISSDGGSTWSPIGATLPYTPTSFIYSLNRKAFFISHSDCGNAVLPDAVMRLDYDLGIQQPLPAPTNVRIVP